MASAEIEKTLKKITDTQLVIVRLMETHERKWNKRFEASQARMERLERRTEDLEHAADKLHRATEKLWRVAEAHEQRHDDVEDRMRTMLASLDRLIKTMDEFAKGRKRENGRR